MNKQIHSYIKEIASKLPVVMVHSHEVSIVTGKEMLEYYAEGEIEGIDKAAVLPERMYTIRKPLLMAANHSRRMKKAYQQRGSAGVKEYVAQINEMVSKQRESKI